jgi:hypothetical protein
MNWDRASLGLDNEPDHTHPFQIPGMSDLMHLARSLGGGSYPGLGSGQNDTLGFPDSVAPGFPLNLPFLVPANTVKQQAVTLTFQPQAYRTYVSPTTHAHAGDSHSVHVHSVSSTLSHGNTGNEAQGHVHNIQANGLSGSADTLFFDTTVASRLSKNSVGAGQIISSTDSSLGSNDHGHVGSALHTTGYVDQTSVSNSSTGSAATPTGVQEGTSPDAMHVMVDGTDVTTQLGGPFSTAQTELDITPYVAAGTGLHMVQVTTATNLGRIAGFVRHKAIVNNLAVT